MSEAPSRLPMMNFVSSSSSATEPTFLQQIARQTRGLATPANFLDGFAFLGARWAAPRLDTWPGLIVGAGSYVSDVVDGKIARATGTTSHIGDLIDHVGDKPKVGYALYYIWKKRLAERPLVAAVAAYNAVTASVTIYDRLTNSVARIEVTRDGKRAMFTSATGVGLQTIATKMRESRPMTAQAMTWFGRSLGFGGLLVFGLPTIRQYWRIATVGQTLGADPT
jgi:phosphatidylglycerophosphate synthase